MHKKSMEAAVKLQEQEDAENDGSVKEETEKPEPEVTKDKEELRSESIAQLRAKAQTYSAKIREGLTLPASGEDERHDSPPPLEPPQRPSGFDTPTKQSDSCDNEYLDPGNWCRGLLLGCFQLSLGRLTLYCLHTVFQSLLYVQGSLQNGYSHTEYNLTPKSSTICGT